MVTRYLNQISLHDAIHILKTRLTVPVRTEMTPVIESAGRMTAAPVFAQISVPGVRVSAMDGFAVRSKDTLSARDQHPVTINDCVRLNTGNPVPEGYDAVIMIEDIRLLDEGIALRSPARPGQHIRLAGEDVRAGRMVLTRGHEIIASDIGALLSYGLVEVPVRTITVGLIPTGGEVIPPGTKPGPGQVVESNTRIIEPLLRSVGISVVRYPIVPDDVKQIRTALSDAVSSCDLVLVSAGSSAGTRDFTASVILDMGEILFHGVSIKPGKSVLCGTIGRVPIIGLPGYPVAAQVAMRELVHPLLMHWGFSLCQGEVMKAQLAEHISSDGGIDEFVLLTVGKIGSEYIALPQSRGAGGQMAGIKANALLHIPDTGEGVSEGEKISVRLTRGRESVEKAIFITGAYDPALEYLDDLMRRYGFILSIRNTGNFGGVFGLMKGICHAASVMSQGTPPPELANKFEEGELKNITLADVQMGLVFSQETSLEDLSRLKFAAHSPGTTQRTLLDGYTKGTGVQGYSCTVRSDTAVIDLIQNGLADAGISTGYLAAQAGLPFVPLGSEHLHLVIRSRCSADPRVQTMIDLIRSDEWRTCLEGLPGYDTGTTGDISPAGEPEILSAVRSKVT